MTVRPILVWFRRDLRLADHAALAAAVATAAPVLAVFVLDDTAAGRWRMGGAARWWLHHSLRAHGEAISAVGGRFVLRRGHSADELARLAQETGASAVYCSRGYEPWASVLEREVRERLGADGVEVKRFAGALLHDPDGLVTKAGTPFRMFTPFWRSFAGGVTVARPIAAPRKIVSPQRVPESEDLASWALLPTAPDWAGGLRDAWTAGETAAHARLASFVEERLSAYGRMRDRPDREGTSRLSPHLAFGEISPRQCWWAAKDAAGRASEGDGIETFLKELAWREFSAHLLHHAPDLPDAPFRAEFASFPWREDGVLLRAWQRGTTGYPIVDAGMRELWATGFMHNRVRMIVASFLTKHLLQPWRTGEAWFWDTLVDADLASNAANWQWVAGSGADAAPYFRIFNPIRQGETFDPEGAYVRRWVPELARLPSGAIHAPWEAPADTLAQAGVEIGRTYPGPIVDHGAARKIALGAFATLRG